MSEFVVSVKRLIKRYGSIMAIKEIDIDIKKGEVFGLLGPNGAGKTITLQGIILMSHIITLLCRLQV